MATVFISYARRDREFAQRLYTTLRAADAAVFVDFEGIAPSDAWANEIQAAIEGAEAFI